MDYETRAHRRDETESLRVSPAVINIYGRNQTFFPAPHQRSADSAAYPKNSVAMRTPNHIRDLFEPRLCVQNELLV